MTNSTITKFQVESPLWLSQAATAVYNGLPETEREQFAQDMVDQTPNGEDLTPAMHRFAITCLEYLLSAPKLTDERVHNVVQLGIECHKALITPEYLPLDWEQLEEMAMDIYYASLDDAETICAGDCASAVLQSSTGLHYNVLVEDVASATSEAAYQHMAAALLATC